MEALMSWDIHA